MDLLWQAPVVVELFDDIDGTRASATRSTGSTGSTGSSL
ncbi:Lsr2 family protein [Rhodococcus sp. ZPP]|nr:Lsr2 family protein [Rhodococcus sp. ZPP]